MAQPGYLSLTYTKICDIILSEDTEDDLCGSAGHANELRSQYIKNQKSPPITRHYKMNYKNIVNQIRSLSWQKLSENELVALMVLSYFAAREFGDSLRRALTLYPTSHGLLEMAEEELETNNLKFADYDKVGDHADFLWHFVEGFGLLSKVSRGVLEAGLKYQEAIRKLSPEVRAMSIVSRESELPGIFEQVLKAENWQSPALVAFRYYLTTHIELDSMEGGHADMLSDFPVDDRLTDFYSARLEMYRSIPTLFRV